MGPKGKPAKGKAEPAVPQIDPKEVVTELEKEFFEFQLADIDKKLNRISQREEELTAGTSELEEKIEEHKKERGSVITEFEQLLATKEEEKCSKREEMIYLSDEIKIRVEKHKQNIENMKQKFEEKLQELRVQVEQLEEEVRILEDYKQNKTKYHDGMDDTEREIDEMEKQHQRNIFAINKKHEEAKVRVKKELQMRLLLLSIDFQQKSQKRIGKPCHRVTQENKAMTGVLVQMKDEILEYKKRSASAEISVQHYKSLKNKKQEDNDRMIAKTIVQVHVKKTLLKQSQDLIERLKKFAAVDQMNKNLLRKLNAVTCEIDRKTMEIDTVNQNIEDIVEESNMTLDSARHLKKNSKRLLMLMRNALKVAEEVLAIRLIQMGQMPEEKHLTMEGKIKLFRNRRDAVFIKKGRLLQYLLELLSKAQIAEEDKKLLKASTDSIDVEGIHFSEIYGKAMLEQESKASLKEPEEEKKKGPVFFTSLTSLPRSLSGLIPPIEEETASEGYEGEFGEYGESYEFEMEYQEPEEEPEEEEGGDNTEEEAAEPQESQDEGDKEEEETEKEKEPDA